MTLEENRKALNTKHHIMGGEGWGVKSLKYQKRDVLTEFTNFPGVPNILKSKMSPRSKF